MLEGDVSGTQSHGRDCIVQYATVATTFRDGFDHSRLHPFRVSDCDNSYHYFRLTGTDT